MKETYKDYPNIILLNLAIHNSKKQEIIYRVNSGKLQNYPVWAKGVASFNVVHFKLFDLSGNDLIKEEVECISLAELIDRYNLDNTDLLQIDTEGYDSKIILNINFDIFRPKIISFEHGLPRNVMSKKVFSDVLELLNEKCYKVNKEYFDAVAYRSGK